MQLAGQIAGVLALLSVTPYLISIFKGQTRPSRAAYAIWLIIDIITVVGYIAAGARSTVWVFLAFALTTFIIFFLSLKYGMGGLNRFDLGCFLLAIIVILLWKITDNPLVALYMGLGAKMVGYIPIFKKSYLQPDTENALSWGMAAAASALNLLALTSWQMRIALAPILTASADILIALLLVFPTWRLKQAPTGLKHKRT